MYTLFHHPTFKNRHTKHKGNPFLFTVLICSRSSTQKMGIQNLINLIVYEYGKHDHKHIQYLTYTKHVLIPEGVSLTVPMHSNGDINIYSFFYYFKMWFNGSLANKLDHD